MVGGETDFTLISDDRFGPGRCYLNSENGLNVESFIGASIKKSEILYC